MVEYPKILGVYSLQVHTEVGAGATKDRRDGISYWYVRQLTPERFEVQPLNTHHVPSGLRTELGALDFLRQYTPEPRYYRLHTVPALESLARKIAMGEAAFALGDLDEAERQFLKALMISERDVKANYGLGEVYSEKKEYAKLKGVLDRLLGIPEAFTLEHRQTFNRFGISLRKNGHWEESIRYYRKSLELNANDEHLHFNLARVYYDQGRMDLCVASLRSALAINPDFAEARRFLEFCGQEA